MVYPAFAGALVVVAAVDLKTRRVPNRLVYPGLVFGVLTPPLFGLEPLTEAVAGGALAFAIMLALALAGRGAMGMGDVKLATLSGLAIGLGGVLPWLVLTFVPAALVALVLLVTRRARLRDSLPLAPFLAGATLVVIVLHGGAIGGL